MEAENATSGVSWRGDTAWRSDECGSRCLIRGRARILDRAAGAVRFAFDLENDRSIDQAVQEGHRQRRIAEVIAPGVEVNVRRQRGGLFLIAGVEDLVEEICRFGVLLAFDAVEAKL